MIKAMRTLKMALLPPSSRSFHHAEEEGNRQFILLSQQLTSLQEHVQKLQQQNTELMERIAELAKRSSESHEYEQTREMMLYWQLFRNPNEDLETAKKRFFRGLPQATGLPRLFQKAEIKLFKEFNLLCKEHNITYWMGSGTLLGAYLYNDIIPWDDDIDVFIPRSDLERLQKEVQNNERYRVSIVWDWFVPCKQIRFRLKDENNPTFIDLFPLDFINDDPNTAWDRVSQARKVFVQDLRKEFSSSSWPLQPYLHEQETLTKKIEGLFADHFENISHQVNFVTDPNKATGLTRGIENIDESHSTGPYYIEDWLPASEMLFSDFYGKIPSKWRDYLTRLYGDFMQIPKDINSHEHVDPNYLQEEKTLSSLQNYVVEIL